MKNNNFLHKYKGAKIFIAWLILLIITLVSFIFLVLTKIGEILPTYYAYIPFEAIGSACLSTLIISFVYEYWIRNETTKELQDALFEDKTIKTILSTERVFSILSASLQRLLNDEGYGNDVYNIITNKNIISEERRYNATTSITLLPIENLSKDICIHYYDLIIDYVYEAIPKNIYRFTCFNDGIAYSKAFENREIEWRWLISSPLRLFPTFNEEFYKISMFKVGGKDFPVQKNINKDGSTEYFVETDFRNNSSLKSTITYRAELKQLRFSHGLFVELREPTFRPTITFDFSKTDITYVSLHTLFTSPGIPLITFVPSPEKPQRIEISLSDWAIPKSGVGFTWQLKLEDNPKVREKCLNSH